MLWPLPVHPHQENYRYDTRSPGSVVDLLTSVELVARLWQLSKLPRLQLPAYTQHINVKTCAVACLSPVNKKIRGECGETSDVMAGGAGRRTIGGSIRVSVSSATNGIIVRMLTLLVQANMLFPLHYWILYPTKCVHVLVFLVVSHNIDSFYWIHIVHYTYIVDWLALEQSNHYPNVSKLGDFNCCQIETKSSQARIMCRIRVMHCTCEYLVREYYTNIHFKWMGLPCM